MDKNNSDTSSDEEISSVLRLEHSLIIWKCVRMYIQEKKNSEIERKGR